jgi:hypothetical protein
VYSLKVVRVPEREAALWMLSRALLSVSLSACEMTEPTDVRRLRVKGRKRDEADGLSASGVTFKAISAWLDYRGMIQGSGSVESIPEVFKKPNQSSKWRKKPIARRA